MKSSKINKPRIALIGVGKFGKNHLQILNKMREAGDISLSGVVESDESQRRWIKKRFQVPVYSGLFSSLLRSVDGVDIVTPASTHFFLVKRCLRYTNIFVEKPLCLSVPQAKQLATQAKKYEHKIFVGHIYRFHPTVNALKELVQQEKKKGNFPYFIDFHFFDFVDRPTDDCGILFSDLHCFDILDYLLDQLPKTIFATTTTRKAGRHHEDEAQVILEYPQQLRASVTLGWNGLPKTRDIDIYFSKKKLHIDLLSGSITIFGIKSKVLTSRGKTPLEQELKSFIEMVKFNSPSNYPDCVVAIRILRLIELAYKSVKEKKIMNIPSQL